ncbi:MAG: dihydroxy-acid dehydratase [Planctomycetota bacterium]|nr:dihydroxy-acid dehydratase [Planctomycetota bacterium]
MSKHMRSDIIKKGSQRSPHRALLKAAGLTDADIRKPLIAICSSHTDVVPGHTHLDAVVEFIKAKVRFFGGAPLVFNTIAICDGIAMGHTGMKYSLPSRELIADCVESMCMAHAFDAMICIPNCDKITPGMLMGALRVNIPTVFVTGGPMEAGRFDGRDVDLIDQFCAVAARETKKISHWELKQYENNTCPTCGSCSGMFTANSMNCLSEAIGMALPGNGTILATSPARMLLYALAAERIYKMVRSWIIHGCQESFPLLPRNIMTRGAFVNAMTLDMAMGGSSNTVLHLLAIANEAGVKFTLDDIDRISKRTPNICRVAPSSTPEGKIYHMQDVHRAGGVHTILGQIAADKPELLDAECMTVTGRPFGRNIANWSLRGKRPCYDARKIYRQGWQATGRSVADVKAMLRGEKPENLPVINDGPFDAFDVIRPVERAFTKKGGLIVLYGNIATNGAIVKLAGLDPSMYRFSGQARIFESQEDACEGILGGKVKAGDVVVIRNEGPRGGPGMQEMLAPTSYIKGLGLYEKCFLITDGRFSGGTSGPSIGHIAPEAAAGGEIGLLKNGDIIEIDIPAGKVNAKVTKAEFARRRKRYKPRPPQITHGALGRYAACATSADTGAILDWPGKTEK